MGDIEDMGWMLKLVWIAVGVGWWCLLMWPVFLWAAAWELEQDGAKRAEIRGGNRGVYWWDRVTVSSGVAWLFSIYLLAPVLSEDWEAGPLFFPVLHRAAQFALLPMGICLFLLAPRVLSQRVQDVQEERDRLRLK